MDDSGLTCELHLLPAGPGLVRIQFEVGNTGHEPVVVRHYEPFADFDLSARAGEKNVLVVQPGYDVGVREVEATIPPGEKVTVDTPVRIAFDPTVPPSGGSSDTTWTLRHAPVTVRLTAVVRLVDAELPPCEVVLDPSLVT